jgi:hypothetical protein
MMKPEKDHFRLRSAKACKRNNYFVVITKTPVQSGGGGLSW